MQTYFTRTKRLFIFQNVAVPGVLAPALAQSPFVPPYHGAQPELVQGVQQGD
ncbi:MAG: hypothetical protein M3347_15035 [Armatimonadota bacterium]|nr:hypothetical protein [Armatimonadota bacterium]